MIGLEPTFEEHLANLLDVFREVWRVLRPDGTLWLNYGDAYAGSPNGRSAADTKNLGGDDRTFRDKPMNTAVGAWKAKDLLMMPARVAIALMDDGWWVRSEIIWHKLNPTPESIIDRPTMAHEKVFLCAKSGSTKFWTHPTLGGSRTRPEPDHVWVNRRTKEVLPAEPEDADDWHKRNLWRGHDYFYDAEAVRTEAKSGFTKFPDGWDTSFGDGGHGSIHKRGRDKGEKIGAIRPGRYGDKWGGPRQGFSENGWDDMTKAEQQANGATLRNVWPIAISPFREAHFATFPPALVETPVKAGTSEKGCCPACGAAWIRLGSRRFEPQGDVSLEKGIRAHAGQKEMAPENGWSGFPRGTTTHETTGWAPSCACDAGDPVPCTVLDPFGGAGTVGLVADRLGRDAILIEINADYVEIARKRLFGDAPLLVDLHVGE